MKTKYTLFFCLFCFQFTFHFLQAQNVGINTDSSVPDASAMLDIKSSNKGLLIPRMTTVQRNAVAAPATGLLVFDTNTNSFWYYSSGKWNNLAAGWSLTGNTGTNSTTNFIGTIDDVPLVFKVSGLSAGIINRTTANTAFGYFSLNSNTTGIANSGLGYWALKSNTTGQKNSAIGRFALASNITGEYNTAIGADALFTNTDGSENTAVGSGADVTGVNFTNATAIGYNARVNASNKVRIGNGFVTVIEGQVPFTSPSDGRYKFAVQEDVKGLDFIMQLRPVTYQFDVQRFEAHLHQADSITFPVQQASYTAAMAIRRSGFIAQEVEQAAIHAGYNFSGIVKPQTEKEHYSLSYESFVVPLVKALQEQQKIIESLRQRLELLEKKSTQPENK